MDPSSPVAECERALKQSVANTYKTGTIGALPAACAHVHRGACIP